MDITNEIAWVWLVSLVIVALNAALWWRWLRRRDVSTKEQTDKVPARCSATKAGWINVSMAGLLELQGIQHALKLIRQTESTWCQECTQAWFKCFVPHSRSTLVNVALELHRQHQLEPLELVELKRNLTATAILYGYSVPSALWQMDRFTVQKVLRYWVLCEQTEQDHVMGPTSLAMPAPHFSELVEHLQSLPLTLSWISATQRPLNFVCLSETLLKLERVQHLCESNRLVLKKALTAMYLIAGVSPPRDYLYVDMQVKDYVLRTGPYQVAKKTTLTRVK